MQHSKKSAENWFRQDWVKESPPPEEGVFELGLSLGGTVSAGAYTAGVLDFLIEALEQWESAKEREKDCTPEERKVPWHRVRLQVVSGASGGGVCAAALARALAYPFPHVSLTIPLTTPAFVPPANANQNPLYRLWVDNFDISGFCTASDSESEYPPLTSLLNPQPLLRGCDLVAEFPGDTPLELLSSPRPYIAEPLTFFLTLSNLTGIPYQTRYTAQSNRVQMYRKHADYARFECYYGNYQNQDAAPLFGRSWPDAFRVTNRTLDAIPPGQQWRFTTWQKVADFARATGAFPIGFPPVKLERPAWHYLYQPLIVPQADPGTDPPRRILHPRVVEPAWSAWGQHPQASYAFVSVDGGAFNNQPGELARRHLAGVEGSNPRDPHKAHRAVVVIDPFTDTIGRGPQAIPDIPQAAGNLLGAWINNARYDTQDFILAGDENTFSRFLVTAVRGTASGEPLYGNDALACAPLQAFGGFLHRAYRDHDYLLGRRNCQQFLRKWFTLAHDNPIFVRRLPAGYRAGRQELPIIPLYGSADEEQLAAPWPDQALALAWPPSCGDEGGVPASVHERTKYLLDQIARSCSLGLRLRLALLLAFPWPMDGFMERFASSRLVGFLRRSLSQAGLSRLWWRR